jgi:hypothetical protein
MDVNKMAAAVFESVRGYVADALAPLVDRIKALEEKPAPAPPMEPQAVAAMILPAMETAVARAVAAIPAPKDGRTPTPEEITAALELPIARALLDFERRAQGILQRAIEAIPVPKDGKDGKDGRDGFSVEDFSTELDPDGRTVVLRFQRGDFIDECRLPFPVVIDRGFWREGMAVAKGDGVTFGGSYWIAQTDTATKPDIGNADWRLAVKKGRDGKNAP